MEKFNKLWKEWGAMSGILLVIWLTIYFSIFETEMRTNEIYVIGWLVQFFGGATFLGFQFRKHNWFHYLPR